MSVALPALAAAFAAFCVWLGVRVYNRRERWAKWTAVALLTLCGYPMSMGPWIAIYVATHKSQARVSVPFAVYRPVEFVVENSPAAISDAYTRYISWWAQCMD